MTALFDRLKAKRGLTEDFLRPKYRPESYTDLPDLAQAIECIKQAIKSKAKILIYGDYDADGITASTVMLEGLKLAGAKQIEVLLPDRFKDGYGMGERVVKRALSNEVDLVITVDCGSNNAEIIAEFNASGVDVIVTDHHEIGGKLPEAVAVINPKRSECKNTELKQLAGVGVAFMVVVGLVQAGLVPAGQEKWLLDLVLIGTVCDNMILTGLNRELCFYGMKVLAKTRRVGLVELMRLAGVKKINTEAIGFLIGPRINAAGRMASPELAFNLINAKSKAEAIKFAEQLNTLNDERKKVQSAAVREIAKRGIGNEPVLVVQGDWHEGVLGIIAGRLVEEYARPAFVLSEVEKGVLKGSGRSFGDFNLANALSECQKWLVTGGGHSGACGLKVLMFNFDDFKAAVNQYYKGLKLRNQERFLRPEADLTVDNIADLKVELVDELQQLEPYGMGNPEPIFKLERAEVLEAQKMGDDQQHLRLTVKGKTGGVFKLVAFYAPEDWLMVTVGQQVDVWLTITANEWNGRRSAEGRIALLEV